MRTLLLRRTAVVGLVAVAAFGSATVGLPAAPARAAVAAFEKESEWSSGYVGKITVRNDTSTATNAWRVEFDLPAGTSVGSHWNANLTRVGTRHVFTNLAWNGSLAAGASTSFGWTAAGAAVPQNCLVDGGPCAGGTDPGPDVSPPAVPGNPRTSYTSQTLTLHWDASTDDRGVTGYEIFSNGSRFATTDTSYTMPVPPPMIFTFGIRAVDAAGNSSPFAIVKLGAPQETEPPTAPTNLRLSGPQDGHYRLTWDASRDNYVVAGYRVVQTGAVSAVTQVGGTFAYGAYRGYGTYLFEVRAFDSSGNLSAPTVIGIAVDPPPPLPSPTR
ncbi:cellulose binding domain-containing protein [Micromonospora sp. WMMD882]|uniref:cellulose binding domain-containing protein n=1 Tax=Micromonospora sp. WMMD882 TaxID=3015151 RepID=UPI00248BCFB1|nr:cellulose binding domain-containing protein [Micromonospora sp. WMMD882]WBB78751.1 cellulose binding domain-containing protein [Micromonospora sp. WMMD882]